MMHDSELLNGSEPQMIKYRLARFFFFFYDVGWMIQQGQPFHLRY